MKIPGEPRGGEFGGRCLAGEAVSERKRVNQSLEKGRKGQWQRRRDDCVRSCLFFPCRSQPELGHSGGDST